MKEIKIAMFRNDLENIPTYSLPKDFKFRLFKEGDQSKWAQIETAVGEFDNENEALERFEEEFAPHLDEFKERCLFIENKEGKIIGTTTAWYGKLTEDDEIMGRIHWVSILPEYQGMKLAKPLLSKAMHLLAKYHSKAYLTSQTTSYKAVNMYLAYGFKPVVTGKKDREAWTLLEEVLDKKIQI